MPELVDLGRVLTFDLERGDVTGAIGDSVTVLPIVVAVGVLTDRSVGGMLLWFGVFQVVWGVHYGVPVSVEPMKALAGLLLAGALTTGEFLVGGVLAGVVLLGIGATGTLDRLRRYLGARVVRGIQLAVAILLLESGLGLAGADPVLATGAGVVALAVIALGYWNLSALVVLGVGAGFAATQTGWPTPAIPAVEPFAHLSADAVTRRMVGATAGQLAMTVGNAAVATALLVDDLFDESVAPDALSRSMGVMTLVAVPLGGLPMCHGSGGVAGKYAFGARTPAANLVLGVGYAVVAFAAVGLVVAYPLSMLGVILALVGLQLAHTSLTNATDYTFVALVAALGALVDIGTAFVVGVALHLLLERHRSNR